MPFPTAQPEVGAIRQKLPRMQSSQLWYYFGPAFVASIAYIDPGNFATNFDGGARFGYRLSIHNLVLPPDKPAPTP